MEFKILEIPKGAGDTAGWREVVVDENNEPLVALGPRSNYPQIAVSSVYYGEHDSSPYGEGKSTLRGALLTMFVRQSVAERLVCAQDLLPAEMKLVVFDAYRTIEVQTSLYEHYISKLRQLFPNMSDEEASTETQKYVSLPSYDAAKPSPHNTGGSVDVALIRHGKMLEFGTPFDHGTERAALDYFEYLSNIKTRCDEQARDNRRLLYSVMIQAGFEPFSPEWWHFNAPESQMGACVAGQRVAYFGSAIYSHNNELFENERRQSGPGPNITAQIDKIAPDNQVV